MLRIASATILFTSLCNVAFTSEVTPLEKVTTMLTDLRTKVDNEGREEAKTYDKFACFCKTNMKAKAKAISEGKTEKDSLMAKINKDASVRTKEDKTIAEKSKEIKKLEDEIAKARKDRTAERLTFSKNEVELTSGLQGLDSAIMAMKASKKGIGFAQLSDAAKTGLVMAQALLPEAPTHSKALTAFISEDAPNDAYGFQGDDIIKTLEDLKTSFRKKKDDLQKAEVKSQAAYDKLIQNKEKAVQDATDALETSKKDKAKATERIATAMQDLTTVSATLLDDQDYLIKLSDKCNKKALLWDKRVKTRANELQALTTAITLLKTLPKKEDKKKAALIDAATLVAPAKAPAFVQVVEQVHRTLAAVSRAAPAGPHEQKQQQKPTQSLAATSVAVATKLRSNRARAVEVLQNEAEVLKSSALSELAAAAAADPFAKVKKLIQELIERLLKEAAQEASHKGWCDKEYAMTTMKRDKAADNIKETNGLLELSEARREKLGEEIKALEKEIKELEDTLKKSTEIRDKEKKENAEAIKEAKEGKKIVAQAMDTLEKFYKTAENEANDFLQLRADPEAPDAGFDEEYAGSQDGSVGVLGMLDVIKSDFERTITETEQDEKDAAQAFNEQETEIGSSKASKGESLKSTKKAKSESDAADSKNRDGLKGYQTILDKSLKEMAALDKACQKGGMTAEERKQQREEEMGALKKALCILDSHGGSADSC